ncbi:uncharacterized protein LOC124117338 [Haliotis rufescens]|uniref:uncharacterized protein LOC124117338 n=1 Tax=Haliotis rufescens TaxID=6454 RepID=UPI00201EA630|nr:uncharacterized protein LOC124117338 [Haliotis rufescens]
MDDSESGSPTADDGTSTVRDEDLKDGDNSGTGGVVPLERPVTPGQDAEAQSNTVNVIPHDTEGGQDNVQQRADNVAEAVRQDENGEGPPTEPVAAEAAAGSPKPDQDADEAKKIPDTPAEKPQVVSGEDGEPDHRESETGVINCNAPTASMTLEEHREDVADTSAQSEGPKPASNFSSPETKVSAVMSDPGDSFGSQHFDTGRESEEEPDGRERDGLENSEEARVVVKEVLSKALMINSDSDTSLKSDSGFVPADKSAADGAAALSVGEGKDGDGDTDSKGPADLSADKHLMQADSSDEERLLDVDQDGSKRPPELEEDHLFLHVEQNHDFDESSPEAERVIEPQTKEAEDEGDDEAEGDDDDDDDDDGVKVVCVGEGSQHPEYPMNYGNYKVCRQVSPGVKECLILETGEHIKYDKKKRKWTCSESPSASPRRSDDESARRSLSESSGGSPKSDNEGERKAFKIVKTPPAMKGTVFMSLKLGDFDGANGQVDAERSEVHDEGRQLVHQPDIKDEEQEQDKVGGAGQEVQDDTREGSGAEAEQISDVLETSPEEVQSGRKVSEGVELQESFLSEVPGNGILKSREEQELPPSRPSNAGSPASLGKPPMSPRMRPSYEQRDLAYRSPPRRREEVDGRRYESVDQSRESYTTDYGNSINGSYITGRLRPHDQYHSLPTHDLSRADHRHLYQSEVVTSPPSSGPVPGYNTLKDQQVSWLKMFKVLEDQHRTQLQSQYSEHQRLIQDIQDQMERELHKQQSAIQHRLHSHRELLRDASPLADRVLSDLATDQYSRRPVSPVMEPYRGGLVDYSSGDSGEGEEEEDMPYGGLSRGPTSSDPLRTPSLRSPSERRVPSHDGLGEYLGQTSTSMPVRRSLELAFDSPSRSPERSYVAMETGYVSPRRSTGLGDSSLSRTRLDVTGDRLLRGGVYSSPMPMSKVKSSNRSLSFSKKSLSESQHSSPPPVYEHRPSPAAERPFDVRLRHDLPYRGEESVLMGDSLFDDSQLSMSTRINLREKHAKHLSDLREYYEAEMAELRSTLSAAHTSSESAHERILREESQELKLRCQSLDDQLHDAKVRIRDLEQKLQGLEIRATDYSTRYDESQRVVLKLRGRVDELHSFVKDKDSQCGDLEAKNRQQAQALKDAYKHQHELTDSNRRDKEALKRLLDKYDDLEKEHDILRGRMGDSDRKLHLSRQEVAERDKIISKLELHNKQLGRENENLKHKAAIALSMASAKTSYEDSYGYSDIHRSAEPNQGEITNGRTPAVPYRSMERLYVSEPGGQRRVESSPESDVDSDSAPSPLLKAERELRRLQTDSSTSFRDGFQPKLQKKFYGSEVAYPGRYREAASNSTLDSSRSQPKNTSSGKSSNSPKPKSQSRNMSRSDTQIDSVGTHNGILSPKRTKLKLQPKEQSTPTRMDVSLNNLTNGHESSQKITKDKLSRSRSEQAVPSAVEVSTRKSPGGKSVEGTLAKVRSGNYVSRPQWEDVDTSMARPAKSQTSPRQNMTREERLRERLQTVDKLERHYDDLQAEKRKLESALIKIPIHGRNRKMIQDQGELEGRLDQVDKELGSVRMSLKRFQVLKSTI